jgi:hypothetical protein
MWGRLSSLPREGIWPSSDGRLESLPHECGQKIGLK